MQTNMQSTHAETMQHPGHAHHAHIPPFLRLMRMAAPEGRELLAILVYAVGSGVFTLMGPVVAMAVVNTVALGTLLQQLFVLCAALFFALGLAAVLSLFQSVAVEYIQRRIFVRIADNLVYRLPRVDLRAFYRQHGPELINRFFDVLTIQKSGATLLLDGVSTALQVGIGLLLLSFYHAYLLGFGLVLTASLVFLFLVLGHGAVRTSVRESIAKFRVAGWMEEIARHPVAFKMASGEQFAKTTCDAMVAEYLDARGAHFRILLRQSVFAFAVQVAASVALLALGGYLVHTEQLTLGQLVAAEIVVTLVVGTFAKFGKQLESFYDLLAAVDKIGYLIDLPIERPGGVVHAGGAHPAKLDVHDVEFAYEGIQRNTVSRFSMRVGPGDRVAVTGPNGSGKSTLMDILYGLRSPSAGWVEFDGMDMRELNLEAMRHHIALVQRIEIFEGTLLDNVRMGRSDIGVSQVRHALEQVGLLETAMALPAGLETPLWTGGSPLSLGHANRLMLARAIVGRPRLLILDETLEQMDESIQKKIIPLIFDRSAPWTLVLVTHSPEIQSMCDRVIRLGSEAPATDPSVSPKI